MIRLACPIPWDVTLACSGGKDSMAALAFLLKGGRNVTVAYFNHGTDHAEDAEVFVKKECARLGLKLIIGRYKQMSNRKPTEQLWRNQRYDFFKTLPGPVVTAHHLNDAAEWWIFTALRGNPKVMPITRKDPDVIRPFVRTPMEDFHSVANPDAWVDDPSNKDRKHTRNRIRHDIVPMAKLVNPGLLKSINGLYGVKNG